MAVKDLPAFWLAGLAERSNGNVGLVLRRGPQASETFRCARLIGELLGTSESVGAATSTQSARQKRNRAFAAEFLVPAESLRDRVGPYTLHEGDDLDVIAAEYGVSSWVVRHQIENHRIAELT